MRDFEREWWQEDSTFDQRRVHQTNRVKIESLFCISFYSCHYSSSKLYFRFFYFHYFLILNLFSIFSTCHSSYSTCLLILLSIYKRCLIYWIQYWMNYIISFHRVYMNMNLHEVLIVFYSEQENEEDQPLISKHSSFLHQFLSNLKEKYQLHDLSILEVPLNEAVCIYALRMRLSLLLSFNSHMIVIKHFYCISTTLFTRTQIDSSSIPRLPLKTTQIVKSWVIQK